MDLPAWSDTMLKLTVVNVHLFQVPDLSWQWVMPRWLIDMTQDVDKDGWQYVLRFASDARYSRHSVAK
ncbi:hypothetical protein IWW55_001166 [Coemansia sp. RSA 2706]|nr:hypothetical protein IWW55_001166 [Coemansia sp. RSA 2706]KAJ2309148.1 hypothetical protein IWW54_003891 [Coemansia sp. RSA 2705]